MDILFCTSEAYPLIKTGGLADVSGSLPKALRELGNDVRIILPAYPEVLERSVALTPVAELTLIGATEPVEILKGRLSDSDVGLYLSIHPHTSAALEIPMYRMTAATGRIMRNGLRSLPAPLWHCPWVRPIPAGHPNWCIATTGRPAWYPPCCHATKYARPPCSASTTCPTRGCFPPRPLPPLNSRTACGQ